MSVDINLSPGCCRAIMGPERCNTEAGGAMAFPENLRRLRLERFLSQADLARRAGMHPITLTRLEAGSGAPSTRSVRALAEALGVEPSALATPDEVAELRRPQGCRTGRLGDTRPPPSRPPKP